MTQSNPPSSVPTAVSSIVVNKVGLLDDYVICSTGTNEYTALIKNPVTKKVNQIVVRRSGTTNSVWQVQQQNVSSFSYSIPYEYYAVSNVGIGSTVIPPVYSGVTSYALALIASVLCFAILFKGVFFKCLRGKRNSFF